MNWEVWEYVINFNIKDWLFIVGYNWKNLLILFIGMEILCLPLVPSWQLMIDYNIKILFNSLYQISNKFLKVFQSLKQLLSLHHKLISLILKKIISKEFAAFLFPVVTVSSNALVQPVSVVIILRCCIVFYFLQKLFGNAFVCVLQYLWHIFLFCVLIRITLPDLNVM